MRELGHKCPNCGLEWVHGCCSRYLDEGLKVRCPSCSGRGFSVFESWHYLDDDFTRWVMEVRKEAGVV